MPARLLFSLVLALTALSPESPAASALPQAGAVVYSDRASFEADFPQAVREDLSALDSASLFTRFRSPLHADHVVVPFPRDSLPSSFSLKPGLALGAADIGIVVTEHGGRRTLGNNAYEQPLVLTFGQGVRAAGFTCFPERSAVVTAYSLAGEPMAYAFVQSEPLVNPLSLPPRDRSTAPRSSPFVGFASGDAPIGYVIIEHTDGGQQTDLDDLVFVADSSPPAGVVLRGRVWSAKADPVSGKGRATLHVDLDNRTAPLVERFSLRLQRARGAAPLASNPLAANGDQTIWVLPAHAIEAGERTGLTAISPPLPAGSYTAVLVAYALEGRVVASLPLPFSVSRPFRPTPPYR